MIRPASPIPTLGSFSSRSGTTARLRARMVVELIERMRPTPS